MHRGLAPVMKAAMNLIGVAAGEPYPPYSSLTREETDALAALLKTTVLAERGSSNAAEDGAAALGAPSHPRQAEQDDFSSNRHGRSSLLTELHFWGSCST